MSINKQELEKVRKNLDVPEILSIWNNAQEGWEEVADTMIDMSSDFINLGKLNNVILLLTEMANKLKTGSLPPLSKPLGYGIPHYPRQTFIVLATYLHIGRKEAREKFDNFEKKFDDIPDNRDKLEYWALQGWAYCIGGDINQGMIKFEKAIEIALSLPSANYICVSLVLIANIMKDAGIPEKAIGVLDAAMGETNRWNEASFSDRNGVIPEMSFKHEAIASHWSKNLQDQIIRTRQSIENSEDINDSFLGYVLNERGKQKLLSQIKSKDIQGLIDIIKESIRNDHRFDNILVICACAVSIYDSIH